MSIPNEVASEFAKLVTSNDSKETEQTVYGTIVLQDGVKYVRFDGSELLTPVSTTTNVENNERVTVLIKEHQAIVTGNITSPAARTQEVTAVNDKFDNYSTTEEMNSKISQTADSIKTEVNKTLSGYVTGDDVDDALKDHPTVAQMNSAIEQKAESITSTVNKTLTNYSTTEQVDNKIADISIGGTNLAADTRLMASWAKSGGTRPVGLSTDGEGFGVLSWPSDANKTWSRAMQNNSMRKPYSVYRNKDVTVSFEFRSEEWTNGDWMMLYFYVDEGETAYHRNRSQTVVIPGSDTWRKVQHTVHIKDDFFTGGTGTLRTEGLVNIFLANNCARACEVRKFKVEIGNKATDWSPAPEDVDNTLKNYPTKTEMNSAITQKADSITSEVNKTLTNYSTVEQMNSKVTQTAESLSAEISGITIGGTNLYPDTRLMGTEIWRLVSSREKTIGREGIDEDGFMVVYGDVATGGTYIPTIRPYTIYQPLYKDLRGKTITFSLEVDTTATHINLEHRIMNTEDVYKKYFQTYIPLSGQAGWQRVSETFTLTDDLFDSGSGTTEDDDTFVIITKPHQIPTYRIRKIKMELGNKATDWSPAPDDGAYSTSAVLDRSGIHLKTGGTFTVDSQNFDVDGEGKMTAKAGSIGGWAIAPGNLSSGSGTKHVRLSTEDATYAIWAGADAAGSAPFRVTRDGKVYLTKLYVTDENGNAQANPVNLSGSWYRTNRAVQSMTVSGNTLTITLYDGTTVNFNKATVGSVTVTYAGQPGQVQVTVKDTNGGTMFSGNVADGGLFNTALKAGTPTATIAESSGSYSITPSIMYNGTKVKDGTAVSGDSIYNAGWNKCIDSCSYASNVYTISQTAPGTLYMQVNGNYTSVGSDWVKTTRATGLYSIPSKK